MTYSTSRNADDQEKRLVQAITRAYRHAINPPDGLTYVIYALTVMPFVLLELWYRHQVTAIILSSSKLSYAIVVSIIVILSSVWIVICEKLRDMYLWARYIQLQRKHHQHCKTYLNTSILPHRE